MPDKNVEVPGLGVVSFPDSMSDDQINSAIKAQLAPTQQTQVSSTGLAQGNVPNARIRNLPNPAEGMSPGRALYEGAKTGLMAGSLPAMAGSPIGAMRAIAGGTVGGMAGKGLAQAGGAGEFGQEVSGDVGSLLGAGALEGLFQTGKSSLAGKLFTPEGEMTALGKAVAHPSDKGGEYALRRLFGFDPDAPDPSAPKATPARPIPRGTNYGQFLLDQKLAAQQRALAAKNAAPPSAFSGMTSSATPATNTGVPTGNATPFAQPNASIPGINADLFEQGRQAFINNAAKSGAMPKPLNPLIATPEEIAAYNQQMRILQQQAHDAGVYHAAQGAAGKSTTLQQRIGKRFLEP